MKHLDADAIITALMSAYVGFVIGLFIAPAPRPQQSLSPAGRGAEHIKTHVAGCKECEEWFRSLAKDEAAKLFAERHPIAWLRLWNEKWEIVRRGTRYSALPGVSK